MSLRIGFDMDGVLADFASAYRAVERDRFGSSSATTIGNPEDEPAARDEDGDPPSPRVTNSLHTASDTAASATSSGARSSRCPTSGRRWRRSDRARCAASTR